MDTEIPAALKAITVERDHLARAYGAQTRALQDLIDHLVESPSKATFNSEVVALIARAMRAS